MRRKPTPRDQDVGVYLKNRNTGKVLVSDDRLVRRELYNPNQYAIRFKRMWTVDGTPNGMNVLFYCAEAGISPGPAQFVLQPKCFHLMQHAFYIPEPIGATLSKGEPIQIVEKFGDYIGDGDPNPSPPEVWQRKHF